MQHVCASPSSRAWLHHSVAYLGLLAALATPTLVVAQAPTPPPHFAIRNARIVTGTGETITGGTIVMENGLITAVGRNVTVPAEAWVIDGSGLTVYPGLIDAMSTVGLPASLRASTAAPQFGGGGPGGQEQAGPQPPYSWGPEDRPATTPWVNAADELDTSADGIETWRNGGFTTMAVTPERGFFPGQAALVATAGDRASDMVVKTPVAMRVNLTSGGASRGYPGSLMGAFAYIKQIFFDAAHYDQAWSIYERSPAGLERPDYDRSLDPLRDALQTRQYVMFPGTWSREILRAINTGEEVGVNTLVYGGHQGYEVADALAEHGVPVLVSLDWPRRDRNADPDADEALRILRFRDRAPTTPGVFEDAGVRFAFYSGGVSDPATAIANARRAIQAGLSSEGALRALTMGPAEIFGVADRLGSLEVGKMANVVVASGDLFDSGTEMRMVFVDGRKFEVEASSASAVARRGGGGQGRGGGEEEEEEVPYGSPVPMVNDRGPIDTSPVTVIQNATVLTVTNGTIENGSVLMRDGKIAEVGLNISVPRGANVVDATGKFVMPGIIDAHSHLAADAINEGSVAVSSMVGIRDVLNTDQVGIYRALAGGVTSANILHGSANPIGGKNAIIKMRWGADADGILFEDVMPGIKFALGENTKRERNPARYPSTRMGVMDVIRQALLDAQEYRREWQEYERSGSASTIPPRRDLKLEALVEVLEGERLVHAHSYRGDEILQLLRVAEEFGFRIATLQHVLEGYKVADEIAEHGAGASTFSDWWAYKVEAYEAIPYNAALMTERGVVVSINSDSGEEIRHLNQEAAKAVRWGGLSEEEALKLVTINPARQLRIDDRVGSLEVGKDADIAIFSDHPLSNYAVPEQVFIDGLLYFDRQHDIDRRQALEEEKQALMDKERRSGRNRVTTDADLDEEGVR